MKIDYERRTEQQKRWWYFVHKADESRLALMVANRKINDLPFCPVETVYNFYLELNQTQLRFNSNAKNELERFARIFRQAQFLINNPPPDAADYRGCDYGEDEDN